MTDKPADTCKVIKHDDDVWRCDACAIAYHDRQVPRPGCAPVTYTRLRDAALDEAGRLEQSQRALVAAGLREIPSGEKLTRAMEFFAIVRLIDKLAPPPARTPSPAERQGAR